MSYTTRAKIEEKIPAAFLCEALDDDGNGIEDDGILAGLIITAEEEVNSYLEGRYDLPLSPVPSLVKIAATCFVCEALYERRGYTADTSPANPWTDRAAKYRERLQSIAEGDEALQVDTEKAEPSVDAVTEPARTHSSSGRLLA